MTWMGAMTGIVVEAPPKLKIKLHSNGMYIHGKKLLTATETREKYQREFSLNGEIEEQSMEVSSSDMSKAGQGPHNHNLLKWGGTGKVKISGTIKWTDDLKKGDLVIMLPTNGNEKFYLLDKVREG